RRRDLLGSLDGLAQRLALLAGQKPTDEAEERALLLLPMMAHALDEHRALRLESLVVFVELVDLGKEPLGHVVLLERFEHLFVGFLQLLLLRCLANGGIEELLLDGGVDRQLAHESVGDRLARLFLETLEQALDRLMIFLQQSKRVHGSSRTLSWACGVQASSRPCLAARRTRSVAEWTCSLRMMRPRCVSTVRLLMHSWEAMSWFDNPRTARSKISRSRCVSACNGVSAPRPERRCRMHSSST